MEQLFKFLADNGVTIEKDKVTAVTLNDATIYCYFEDGNIKIDIEPHDVKVNLDKNIIDALGVDLFVKEEK